MEVGRLSRVSEVKRVLMEARLIGWILFLEEVIGFEQSTFVKGRLNLDDPLMVNGINLLKSNLYGVDIGDIEIGYMVSFTGCSRGSFPFTYLGIPVGESMLRVKG
uniref:Uncharacterized protein n=1 Tax=Lactuca sativa TaxID=4236 RepID=A0A9R1WHX2_LACSA|nr:hypothetical protein LSAT_V11C100017070 [Lactuca sativa]